MTILSICILIFFASLFYASVGHGGASAYIAILLFFSFSIREASAYALVLNILVSGLSLYAFYIERHLNFKYIPGLLIGSVPAAFIGGSLQVNPRLYYLLFSLVLMFMAYRIFLGVKTAGIENLTHKKDPNIFFMVLLGAVIGFISGVIGIGGGIFLSPIILLKGWLPPKQTSALASCFILMNSITGLFARFIQGSFSLEMNLPFLLFIFFAFCGGYAGSYLGAKRFHNLVLCRILGGILSAASVKLLILAI